MNPSWPFPEYAPEVSAEDRRFGKYLELTAVGTLMLMAVGIGSFFG